MSFFVSGDQNHGSPMMQQNMRSQTPGMNPVPNSQQGMGQPRMVGPQGNVSLDSFFRQNTMHSTVGMKVERISLKRTKTVTFSFLFSHILLY